MSDTPGADAVASAVVAVPILVLDYIIDVVFIISSQTEGTVLPLALVIHFLRLFRGFALILGGMVAATTLTWV